VFAVNRINAGQQRLQRLVLNGDSTLLTRARSSYGEAQECFEYPNQLVVGLIRQTRWSTGFMARRHRAVVEALLAPH
jgi:hypothetical protein